MAQIDLKHASVIFEDGSTPPNTLEIKMGEGNLTWTESQEMIYTLDRGRLDDVREGDEQPVQVSINSVWEFLKGDGDVTPRDFLHRINGASEYVSVDPDQCRPFAINIVVLYEPPCGGEKAERIVLPHFRKEEVNFDIREATLDISGRCNATRALVTRED